MKKWRIGVVSATGFSKHRHLPEYAKMENVELAACCDMNEAGLKQSCDEFNVPGRYTELDAMLADDSLEIIVVVNRPEWHIPTARKCVEAGKHVLVEKPLSENYRELLDFRDWLKGRKEKVMVSQNYRFQNPALEMADVIRRGELGEVYWAEIVKYNSAGPNAKDNPRYKSLFINIGVHDVDQLRFFFPGREVEAVFAPRLRVPHAPDVTYPFTEIEIFFEGGIFALARMDWSALGLESWTRVRVEGSKAVGVCNYPDSPDILVQGPDEPVRQVHREEPCNDILKVMRHFTKCLEEGREPDTNVGDNIKTMEILLAAYLSCRDRRVVHFPEDREALLEI